MANEDKIVIGQRIRESRQYLDLSQEEVAAALGIPRSAVSSIESGGRSVDAIELKKLAKLLNRTVQYLAGDEAPAPGEEKVALLARATEGLSDDDLGELQRFAAYLKARSDQN